MYNNTPTGARASQKVILRIVASYISAVVTILLICLLSAPIALLSSRLNLSQGTFLVLSAVPVLVSVYVIQRRRVGERTLETALARTFKQEVDISQIRQVRTVQSIWGRIRQVAERRMANWSGLYRLVKYTRQEVSDFNRAASHRRRSIMRLVLMTGAEGAVGSPTSEVSRVIRQVDELGGQMVSLRARILNYNDRAAEGAKSLLQEGGEQRRLGDELDTLRSELQDAEESLTPTLWTWIESWNRGRWLRAYDRSYQRQREAVIEYLEMPFDPRPILANQQALLAPLVGDNTIHCRDGTVSFTLNRLGLAPLAWTRLSADDIERLGDL
jgi:hypothetical protein